MSRIISALIGFLVGAGAVGFGWYLDKYTVFRKFPSQIPFEAQVWRQGDASTRGRMYHDVVRLLQEQRPTDKQAEALLGPPGVTDKAYLNAAKVYLIYQIDLGQRMGGRPFLDKLGIAFQEDGSYSHVTTWD